MTSEQQDEQRGMTSEMLRRRAVREQARSRVPSVVLGTRRGGGTLGLAAAGLADVERRVAADPHAVYRIGSITKTFTAAVVLGLVEEGRLELDSHVGEHLPGTPLERVPLRSLLSHTSGVQREAPGDMWDSMLGPDGPQLREALARAELVDRPGSRWHYSNLGYAVLGQIVEQVTGTACLALIEQRLIEPLGLQSTVWARPDRAAVGYRVDPYADLVHVEPDMDQAAIGVGGQLWSTASDLLTWGWALAGGAPEIVSGWVVESMHTLQVMIDTSAWTSGWGLGLILERRGERLRAGHTGAMPGFTSALSFDRATGSVAVALSNATRGADLAAVAGELVDELAGSAPDPVPASWSPTTHLPGDLDGVLGRWWSEAEETVFTWRVGALHARLVSAPASAETRFVRVGVDEFRAVTGRFAGERLTVSRDQAGKVSGLVWATYPFRRTPR